jgi:hypothetical protein
MTSYWIVDKYAKGFGLIDSYYHTAYSMYTDNIYRYHVVEFNGIPLDDHVVVGLQKLRNRERLSKPTVTFSRLVRSFGASRNALGKTPLRPLLP